MVLILGERSKPPQQHGFVERFDGSLHREFLEAYLFEKLNQVREMA
jgi:putative transposase